MPILIFTLILGVSLGHLIFLFNKTDFVIEYGSKLGLQGYLKSEEYETWKSDNDINHDYPIFLRERFKTFGGRLVGCPFCLITFLSVWLSLLSWSLWFPLVALAAAGVGSIIYMVETWLYKSIFS